jgi:NAD(P)-dependent dehydrogenase (short-subunit alcohol dehydrogenase family)
MRVASNLDSKVGIVTGGSSGIGRASARALADEGVSLAIADIQDRPNTDDDPVPTAELIREAGGEAIYVETDVSDEKQVETLVERTIEEYGKLDVLVNCAGTGQIKGITDTSLADWYRVLDVNLTGTFLTCRAAIPAMLDQTEPTGSIINTSSTWGLQGGEAVPAYCASKGGVELLTKQLAVDYSDRGIRANTLVPGWTETGMTRPLLADDEQRAEMERSSLLNRIALPEEIAEGAVFLASDRSRYMTGHSLEMNAGATVHE